MILQKRQNRLLTFPGPQGPSKDFRAFQQNLLQDLPPCSPLPLAQGQLRLRRIQRDLTPLTSNCGSGPWDALGSYQSQGSVTSRSRHPPGSYTSHKDLWPQLRRIQLDPTPLTGICGLTPFTGMCCLGVVGSSWILHSPKGSMASAP